MKSKGKAFAKSIKHGYMKTDLKLCFRMNVGNLYSTIAVRKKNVRRPVKIRFDEKYTVLRMKTLQFR